MHATVTTCPPCHPPHASHVTPDACHAIIHNLTTYIHSLEHNIAAGADWGMSDGEGVVQVAQRVERSPLALHRHEELIDALHRQLVALHQSGGSVRTSTRSDIGA